MPQVILKLQVALKMAASSDCTGIQALYECSLSWRASLQQQVPVYLLAMVEQQKSRPGLVMCHSFT